VFSNFRLCTLTKEERILIDPTPIIRSVALTLGIRVLNPFDTCVNVFLCCVVQCRWRSCDGSCLPQKRPYQLSTDIRNFITNSEPEYDRPSDDVLHISIRKPSSSGIHIIQKFETASAVRVEVIRHGACLRSFTMCKIIQNLLYLDLIHTYFRCHP
jgi:hypothetical protein